MPTDATFSTALVGQAESAFGAILDRELAGTGLSAPQWITLSVALAGGGTVERGQLVERVARARRVDSPEVQAYVDDLIAAQLVQATGETAGPVTVTEAGRQLHRRVSTAVTDVTRRLWGDLAAEDLAAAARVLSAVLVRAEQELAGR